MNELKPCPFCGSRAREKEIQEVVYNENVKIQTIDKRFIVFCCGCHASSQEAFYKVDAIYWWNRRVKE